MSLRDLEGSDRTVARIGIVLSALLLGGLLVSGVWQLVFHEPAWDDLVVGSGRPVEPAPTGVADLHRTLADLAAGFALLVTIWLSYRVLARIAWSGVAAMAATATGILTGSIIRVDAVVRDGEVDADARGYLVVIRGDYDFVVAGSREFGPAAASALTLVHLACWLLVLAVIVVTVRRARRRRLDAPPADPSWLDRLRP